MNRTARVGQPKAFQRIERRPPARRYWREEFPHALVADAENQGRMEWEERLLASFPPSLGPYNSNEVYSVGKKQRRHLISRDSRELNRTSELQT